MWDKLWSLWVNLCFLRKTGLIFDLIILVAGGVAIYYTIKWARKKKETKEKFFIALLLGTLYVMHAITSYDVHKCKCDCPAPDCFPCYHNPHENPEDLNTKS